MKLKINLQPLRQKFNAGAARIRSAVSASFERASFAAASLFITRQWESAVLYGDSKTVEKLLKKKPELVNHPFELLHNTTALHLAVADGRATTVSLLLQYGAKADEYNYLGQAPLMMAVKKAENLEMVKNLVAHAPQLVEQPDVSGRFTPLMQAALNGQKEMVQFLLDNGAKAETKNAQGLNALSLMQKEGRDHKEIAQLLKDRMPPEKPAEAASCPPKTP